MDTGKERPPSWAIRTKADLLALDRGAYWDSKKARRIIQFTHAFYRPQYIPGEFRLLDWQERFLMSIYGWRNADGSRRFRTVNLHISKKNGKSMLAAIILLFELFLSEHKSPFTASASVTRENASQIYAEIKHSIRHSALRSHAKAIDHRKAVTVDGLNAEHRSLASDGDSSQGLNLTACVLDELHAMRNAALYDSLRYSTIARKGLMVYISTSGDDPTHFYHAIYTKSKNVLNGTDLDTTHYAEVYEADPEADFETDKAQWYKANPSLGVSFTEEDYLNDLLAAKKQPHEWAAWKRYRANLWTNADDNIFTRMDVYDAALQVVDEQQLRDAPCVLGIDGSQTTDPTVITAAWKLGPDRYHIRSWPFVCRAGLQYRESTNLQTYNSFPNLEITEGVGLDVERIKGQVRDLANLYRVESLVFDPNMSHVFMADMEREGFTCFRQPQTHAFYSPPMKWFGALLSEGKVSHDGDPFLRYCFSNLRVDRNHRGEIRPVKKHGSSGEHIDGAVAAFLAFGLAAQLNHGQPDKLEVWGG